MTETADDAIIKTLGSWRTRRRADGTHYAENGTVLATTTEADELFEMRFMRDPDLKPLMLMPTEVLGELLGEEIGRGRHPRAPGSSSG